MVKKWLWISVLHLLLAALMGCLLRLYAVGIDTGLSFSHVLHAHSHTAMMGWVYIAIAALVFHFFLNKSGYSILFSLTIVSVWGLMISFLLQGYALFSILFCCLHLFCSYWFTRKTLRDLKPDRTQGAVLLRVSLYLLVISTLGIWAIGPSIALAGKGSALFSSSIQFYLHFQFNGFFFFALAALFFKIFEIKIPDIAFKQILRTFLLALVLTLALPLSWYYPGSWWKWLQHAGSILQFYGFILLLRERKSTFTTFYFHRSERILLYFSGFSLLLKGLFPLFLIYPDLMQLSHEVRSISIAYIHMVMLGLISSALLFFMVRANFISSSNTWLSGGTFLFITGFTLTETLLFIQGLQIIFHMPSWSSSFIVLAASSFLLPLGVICWLLSFKKT